VWQALSSAIKLPLLFLVTAIICAPALYIFSTMFGSRQRLDQSIVLIFSVITLISILLLSFAPIAFFFMISSSDYQFFKLLNVLCFSIAGSIGMFSLKQGWRTLSSQDEEQRNIWQWLVLHLWMVLYAFVGGQMAWMLRPFVGYPHAKFELFRQVGGNFYSDIFFSLGELLGFFVVM